MNRTAVLAGVLIGLFISVSVTQASAQGRLFGRISDQATGTDIHGATVRLDNHAPVDRQEPTNSRTTGSIVLGAYTFTDLPARRWTMTVSAHGYLPKTVEIVTSDGRNDPVHVELVVGGPQWKTTFRLDDFTDQVTGFAESNGTNRQLHIVVSCIDRNHAVLLDFVEDGIFADRHVEARWDGGRVERYQFVDYDDTIAMEDRQDFVAKLKRHNEVRLRVTKWRNTRVVDTIGLAGSTAAINDLGC